MIKNRNDYLLLLILFLISLFNSSTSHFSIRVEIAKGAFDIDMLILNRNRSKRLNFLMKLSLSLKFRRRIFSFPIVLKRTPLSSDHFMV